MSIKHIVDITYIETFKSKTTFERDAKIQGVVIKGYHNNKIRKILGLVVLAHHTKMGQKSVQSIHWSLVQVPF